MTFTVYDKVDLAEEGVRTGEPDAQKLYEAKREISAIDDELRGVAIKLSTHARLFKPDDLEELSKVLKKLSERLY